MSKGPIAIENVQEVQVQSKDGRMIIMKLVFQIGQALLRRSSGNMAQDLEEASHGQTRRSGCQCLRRNLLDERI
jgi:hypothetical protein